MLQRHESIIGDYFEDSLINSAGVVDLDLLKYVVFNADHLMYWVSIGNPAVEMSTLNGTGRVTLFNESNANYTGIALYNNFLYISDKTRRSAFFIGLISTL